VLCVIPARMAPTSPHDDHMIQVMKASRFGGHSTRYGAPEAEMDLPYGHMAQNTGYAMIAQRYAAVHGYDAEALARIAVHQRHNACHNPEAMFFGQPITVHDVLASRMVAEPLRMLEIVMPVAGGAAVIVTRADIARRCGTARCRWWAAASMCTASRPPTRRHAGHAHRPGLAQGLRRWPASSLPTCTWRRSTTATPSPCC
jgi:acetyl-CoA acetyltransferase